MLTEAEIERRVIKMRHHLNVLLVAGEMSLKEHGYALKDLELWEAQETCKAIIAKHMGEGEI